MSLRRSRSNGRNRIRWLNRDSILAAHEASLARFGGATGVRSDHLLDSALARPQQIAHYERGASLHRLAAAYAASFIKNHPFVDGNKRAGLLAVYMFLGDNGVKITATEPRLLEAILKLASGGAESDFAEFLAQNTEPV